MHMSIVIELLLTYDFSICTCKVFYLWLNLRKVFENNFFRWGQWHSFHDTMGCKCTLLNFEKKKKQELLQ